MNNKYTETTDWFIDIDHTKRFVLIFNMFKSSSKWTSSSLLSSSITDYDTIEEVKSEIKMINDLYRDDIKNDKVTYCLLDYKECKIKKIIGLQVKVGNKCISKKDLDDLQLKDMLFRGKDEIPKLYTWDVGEYDGWLQYRWGDGKNKI